MQVTNSLEKEQLCKYARALIYNVVYSPEGTYREFVQLYTLFYNTITPMFSELSKLEVTARRIKKSYILDEQLNKINNYVKDFSAEMTYRALVS